MLCIHILACRCSSLYLLRSVCLFFRVLLTSAAKYFLAVKKRRIWP